MKKETTFRALGEIDDRYLEEAMGYSKPHKKGKILKILVPVAAVILCFSVAFTVALPFLRNRSAGSESPLPNLPSEHSNDPASELRYDDFAFEKKGDHAILTGYLGAGSVLQVPGSVDNTPVTKIEIHDTLPVESSNIEILFNNDSLSAISLPEGFTVTLHVGKDVQHIAPSLLLNEHIVEIKVDAENQVYASFEKALYSKDFSTLLSVPRAFDGTLLLKKELKIIGENAFQFCKNLKNLVLPEGVTEIRENALLGCSNLENITLPSGLKTAPEGLLKDAVLLKTITSYLTREKLALLHLGYPEQCQVFYR